MMEDVLVNTSFLDYKNPSVKERVFYYIFEKSNEDLCPECGHAMKFHNKLTPRKNVYCSKRCANIANVDKITESRKKNDNTLVQEKRRKTCLEKYGVDHVWKNAEVRKKCRETTFERHGYFINFQSQEFIETSLKKKKAKYGEHLEGIFEKSKNTCLKKYGVDNIWKNKKTIEKIQEKRLFTVKERQYQKIKNTLAQFAKLELLDTKEEFKNKEKDFSFKCLMCGVEFKSDTWNRIAINIPCTCRSNSSKSEYEIQNFIETHSIKTIRSDRVQIAPLELDIYIPEHKLAIEFDGLYWHSELFRDKNYHLNKTKMCEEKGIQIIHVFENEWLEKQEIVKSIIKSKLGLYNRKIYARKCEIREIDNDLYKKFVEENHLQGYTPSKYRIGLFYEDKLVQLCSFGVSRFKKNETELIRSCSLLNTQVIGGFDKLVQYFIKTHKPENLISYVDRRYFNGKGYKNWELIEETKPNYWYTKNCVVKNRINYQKHKLPKLLEKFDINKTEVENMYDNRI